MIDLHLPFLARRGVVLFAAAALAVAAPVHAARSRHTAPAAKAAPQPAPPPVAAPAGPTTAPIPPVLAAKAWLLVDMTSGERLAGENENARVEPASLTKLMVDYLTLSAIRDKKLTLNQAVPVPTDLYQRVNRRTESVMFIPPGKTATVDDLLHGLIIQSGNDAAIVLAEAVGGSEASFVEMMNREAKRLGMNSTSFRNPSGMSDPEHYTTASDLAILVTHLITEFPEFYPLYSQKEFTYNGIKQGNRNLLLWKDSTVDGVKTGHTEAAGFCLIASAKRPQPADAGGGDRRLLSVLMGANSADARAQESLKLLNWGFQNFDAVRLYAANQAIATPRLWKGTETEVKLGFQHPVYLTLPKGQAGNIKSTLDRKDPLVAPIAAGDRVGTLKLTLDGKPVADLPVVALETVPQAGFFGRAWDAMRLLVQVNDAINGAAMTAVASGTAPAAPSAAADPLVYLRVSGRAEMVPLSEARVPVLDRGFIFGDGIYEVVPVYRGRPFRVDQHLARLARSLASISIANPFATDEWKARIAELVSAFEASHGIADQFVYMQVTRGVAKRAHAFPKDIEPTVFMMTSPLVLPSAEVRANGVAAVTQPDNRWLRCDIKSVSLLGNVLMAEHAASRGVLETILLRDGFLTEGSSSNVWVFKDGVLRAPPKDSRILEGIRYGMIAEMADAHGVPFRVGPIAEADLRSADELMLSSATKEVVPVVRLDDVPVGDGAVGPMYRRFYGWYQDAKAAAG